MAAEILRAGFAVVQARPMTFGIVALHVARK
jgi:ubiquinone/menaquinone biosynthesis C-methylase UbiE